MAPKNDPNLPWRPCGDYRLLNRQTVPDRNPMPNLADLPQDLAGSTVFTKLDLVSGYNHIPMAAADQPKTAVSTPFGLYLFRRMPFGLRNAAQTFQRFMDSLFRDYGFVKIYLDDILIASKTLADHEKHVETVLRLVRTNGLRLRRDKCQFARESVYFAGVELSKNGIRPIPEKVDAIAQYPLPMTVKSLKRFLGMAAFYHRFIPGFSHIASPLTDMTRSKVGQGNFRLEWSTDAKDSFDSLKKAVCEAITLSFPLPGAELTLTTDASGSAAGGVLHQRVTGTLQPLAFFSAKFSPLESKKIGV